MTDATTDAATETTTPHDWVMIAVFGVTDQQVEQLAAARVDPTGQGRANVELQEERLLTIDGPGCRVCGLEWSAGYGVPCVPAPSASSAPSASAPIPLPPQSPVDSGLLSPPPPRLILPGE